MYLGLPSGGSVVWHTWASPHTGWNNNFKKTQVDEQEDGAEQPSLGRTTVDQRFSCAVFTPSAKKMIDSEFHHRLQLADTDFITRAQAAKFKREAIKKAFDVLRSLGEAQMRVEKTEKEIANTIFEKTKAELAQALAESEESLQKRAELLSTQKAEAKALNEVTNELMKKLENLDHSTSTAIELNNDVSTGKKKHSRTIHPSGQE